MANFKKQLGYVLENKNICINGYVENTVLFQDTENGISKQKKAKLNTNTKGTFFTYKGKRNYVSIVGVEVEVIEVNEVNVESVDNTLSEMIGNVGELIAGLQTVNSGKTLKEINHSKYESKSNFSKWLEGLVKSEIKKGVDKDHQEAISLLQANPDLIGEARNKVQETFLKVFSKENLQCKTVNVDKAFGESTISKYSFLAKENGFNSNDVDRLIQSIIYGVLKVNNRLQLQLV